MREDLNQVGLCVIESIFPLHNHKYDPMFAYVIGNRQVKKEHRHPTLLVARRIAMPLETVLILLGVATMAVGVPSTALWMLTIWVIAAITYVIIALKRLRDASRDPERNQINFGTELEQVGVWSTVIRVDVAIITVASLTGVISALMMMRNASTSDHVGLSRVVAALSIIGAWMLLQFGFSRLYADTWFRSEEGGLEFPGTKTPGLIEFAYFTFSIGATFQTSDTNVTGTYMRWLVTIHAVICFFYNTLLLAFAVGLLIG